MKYGLIGEKLGHSLSKKIYNMCGLDYKLVEIAKNDITNLMEQKLLTNFNVTIPYKQTIIPLLDYVDSEAKEINAVNTVFLKNDKWLGYNTDIFGMKLAINKARINLHEKNVLILGTGGTSNTAYFLAKTEGASTINKVSRTGEINYNNCYDLENTNVIINATPQGMYPNNHLCPVDLSRFKHLEGVFDAVYNPLNTSLIVSAKKLNINASGGLYMLVGQAIKSMSIFNDCDVDYKLIDKIYNELKKDFCNLVLVGMPGSGKTTLGKMLGEKLNKQFVDLDELFVQTYHTTPANEILVNGEKSFREKESEVIKSVKQGGLVVATGGGSVLKSENVSYLKQNGIIVYVDRDISKLAKEDRPLSQQMGLSELYKVRKPLYEGCCDFKVQNNDDLQNTLKEVLNDYEKYFSY